MWGSDDFGPISGASAAVRRILAGSELDRLFDAVARGRTNSRAHRELSQGTVWI